MFAVTSGVPLDTFDAFYAPIFHVFVFLFFGFLPSCVLDSCMILIGLQ
jgi:hypothetical protein